MPRARQSDRAAARPQGRTTTWRSSWIGSTSYTRLARSNRLRRAPHEEPRACRSPYADGERSLARRLSCGVAMGTRPARQFRPSSCRRYRWSPTNSFSCGGSTTALPHRRHHRRSAGRLRARQPAWRRSFGYLLGMSPTAELALSPYILALQIAPKVAFAPLFILWMGFTVYPKILVAILIVFFPVMVNVLTAVRAVDPDLINLARAFKATRAQIFLENRVSDFDAADVRRTCASARRSLSSASLSANWSAAMSGSAICSPSARARPIRPWSSSRSSC